VSDETNTLAALPPKPLRLLQYFWYDLHHALPSGRRRYSPIFIVGCGHSGTSLMLRMLGAHSRLHAIPNETGAAIGEDDQIFRLLMRNFDKTAALAGKLRWVEKTPKHVHHIAFIRRLCPEAKFVGMVRDSRDVCNSLKKRFGSISLGIKRWLDDNESLRAVADTTWCHVVRYEDLISAPQEILARLMEFLDEYPEPCQLTFHRNAAYGASQIPTFSDVPPPDCDNTALRKWQINQPLFDGRGKWENELSACEVKQVSDGTADLALKFGYRL